MLKGRLEDDRMLTGRGRYVSDWNLPGQAYAHFLRSDRAHAEIVSIDASAALAHPGVLAVLTGEDVAAAGLKSLPAARAGQRAAAAASCSSRTAPALAQGKRALRRRAGGDRGRRERARRAQDAAELVARRVSRSAGRGARRARRSPPGAPQLHDDVPGNCVFDYESGDEKAAGGRVRARRAGRDA